MRFLVLGLFSLSLACEDNQPPPPTGLAVCDFSSVTVVENGQTLATINGQIIGTQQLEERARGRVKTDAFTPELRQELLDDLISETLTYQDALSQGYDRHPKIRRSMVTLLKQDSNQSLTEDLEFEEQELLDWYQDHQTDFIVPEKIQLRRILIKITPDRDEATARAEIERIHRNLTTNIGRFTRFARRNSEDPHRNNGGNIGAIERRGRPGLDAEIVQIAFDLEPEVLSKPVQTREGFNLLFVDTHDPEVLQTFEQVRSEVLGAVRNIRVAERRAAYVEELKLGSTIEIDQSALDAFELSASDG
jgi:parvulin-like peptidyl-prolyl isomerase